MLPDVPIAPVLGTTISVGEHVQKTIGGLTFNMDTVWATAAAMVVVIVLGLLLRHQITSGVPGKLQMVWELGVEAITKQVSDSIGPPGMSVIPLALTLFVFIFVCNTFEALGLGSRYEWLSAPTGDINLPAALAIFVIVGVHAYSIRARGLSGYLKHYLMQPFPIYLMPFNLFINLVEEIAKPITLALRLFGNLLSGALMLTLIAYLGVWKLGAIPIGNILVLIINPAWKLFDLGIGAIQAFIFALLTILYFDTAMSVDHDEGTEHAHSTTAVADAAQAAGGSGGSQVAGALAADVSGAGSSLATAGSAAGGAG